MAPAAADARFRLCLAETLKWEGGYSNDPYDPGGATMKGIIQREYDAYRTRNGKPKRAVRMIERSELEDIYRHSYWDEVRADELPAGVDMVIWDFGVNSGPTTAIKHLQRALGVAPDGHIGQITLDAIEKFDPDEIVEKVMASRRAFLRRLRTFWRFGKGWMARCDGVEQVSLAWSGAYQAPLAFGSIVVEPNEDPEAQSAQQGRAWENPPASMAQSTTGNTAGAIGTTAGATLSVEVGGAVQAAYVPGQGIDWIQIAITLSTSLTFWAAVGTLVGAVVIWVERRHKLMQEAV